MTRCRMTLSRIPSPFELQQPFIRPQAAVSSAYSVKN
jgi:hypothetical protein